MFNFEYISNEIHSVMAALRGLEAIISDYEMKG